MTYIQTKRNGWCYLSTIMDLHSRRIIDYSITINDLFELWKVNAVLNVS